MSNTPAEYFGAAVKHFAANAKRASGPMGMTQNAELYDLSLGLECFLRGVVGRLNEIDVRLDALEKALVPEKSAKLSRR
jgi:hypothetical protein